MLAAGAGDNVGSGADGQVRGRFDQPADLEQIGEDGGVDGARAGVVVVDVGYNLDVFGGEMEPGPVEGRDVAPVPATVDGVSGDGFLDLSGVHGGRPTCCGI